MKVNKTNVFTERVVISVLDLDARLGQISIEKRNEAELTNLVEVIFVQLSNKTREVRVLERPRKNSLRKFIHILHDEAIAVRTP